MFVTWKMYATIFAFAFVAVYVAAEIPSYIHVCGRRDPKIDQCILNNVNNLKSKICQGIPELDVPSNDPFVIDTLALTNTSDIKLYIRNAQLTGLCDFKINNFSINIDTLHYNFEILFDQLRANTTYDFEIRLLVPVVHQGQLYITSDNVGANVTLDFNVVTKRGQKYTYLAKIKINFNIKGYTAKYDADEERYGQLREIIRDFIGRNQKEIISSLKPTLEEIISRQIVLLANNIVKHFTYDELFPDRI
ncbi:uncharacterized protein LOC105203864 [Solenopsis invicta]|uniref:uncharacterized protein LOC105203864 n=1 Tax=Solenopsis invicta TaxID=13686 RepID=UPI00193D70C7|nr:uncharacterized protein LOC105203864 [Solenopsis invicta]